MSFRFAGTALTILSTSAASGLYFANGLPPSTHHGASVVVPISQPRPESHLQTKAVVSGGNIRVPRIWVGVGASVNPATGEPLTRDEQESGWVDAPNIFAREIVRTVADPLTGAPKMVREPNPEVMVLNPGEKAPAWVRGTDIVLGPGVEVEEAPPHLIAPPPPEPTTTVTPPPLPAAPPAHTRPRAHGNAPTKAPAKASTGYRIHLESYRDRHHIGSAWAALQKANPAVLGPLQSSTMAVEGPKKAKFVRLLAGPFENKKAAEVACATIKQEHSQQYCQPVRSGH